MTDKEQQTLNYVNSLVEFSKMGIKHSGVLSRRKRAKEYYDGKHAIKNRDKSLGTYVFNKFAQIARSRTAHIVSKKPKWRFMPNQEGAILSASALQDIMGNVIWNKIKWNKKGELSVNEARDAGSSHIKIFIRPDGFPEAIPLSAQELILDPKAKKKEHLRFWGHVYPMSVKDIEQVYGKKVKADTELENLNEDLNTSLSYYHTSANTAPSRVFKGAENVEMLADIIGRALVYELWMEDKETEYIKYDEAETISEHESLIKGELIDVHPLDNHPRHIKAHEKFLATLDPDADKDIIALLTKHIQEHATYPNTTRRKKYPFGRRVIFTKTEILEDKPNPIAAEMRTGIDFRDLLIKWDYDYSDGYWGKPGVADLFDPQDIFNHRVNSITQGINRLNHGIRKVITSGKNQIRGGLDKLANWVGITIPVRHKDEISIDYGPQMPSQIFENLFHTERFMDVVSDNTDIMSGNFPKGSPPGVTVNQLLGEGMKPINLIVKHYAEALQEMGRVMMQLMIEFVPDNVKFRIVDDKGKYQYINWELIKEDMGYYDIHIDIDSMLETSRQERLALALQLFDKGIYDRTQVLKKLDDPDKYEVEQRMGEIQILQTGLQEMEDSAKNWEGQFRNLAQNYNRLAIELDKERTINKELKNAAKKKNSVSG